MEVSVRACCSEKISKLRPLSQHQILPNLTVVRDYRDSNPSVLAGNMAFFVINSGLPFLCHDLPFAPELSNFHHYRLTTHVLIMIGSRFGLTLIHNVSRSKNEAHL